MGAIHARIRARVRASATSSYRVPAGVTMVQLNPLVQLKHQ